MKKAFYLALAAVSALILSGCGKDSQNQKDSDKTVAKLEVCFTVDNISKDVLDYFSIDFNYTDFNGKASTKSITGKDKITFSINNPGLGEVESCPFTAELKFTDKGTAAKTEGKYQETITYSLDINGYYSDGSLITDSGVVRGCNNDTAHESIDRFKSSVGRRAIEKVTYKTFFCKTLSGEWHIGSIAEK